MSSTNSVSVNQTVNRVVVTTQDNHVLVSSPGPQGIQGEDGSSGGVFEYTQASPATPWVINHMLNCYPSVTVIVDGEEVDSDVVYGSLDQVTVSFAEPQSGVARLRP